MPEQDNQKLAHDLVKSLGLQHPPLAIHFSQEAMPGSEPFADDMPAATDDGRTGRVPAGCVFWMKAEGRTFSTVAEDHANCSVSSLTHGFKSLDEVGNKSDVGALVGARWVTPDMFPAIPVVKQQYGYKTYGPLQGAVHAGLHQRRDIGRSRTNNLGEIDTVDGVNVELRVRIDGPVPGQDCYPIGCARPLGHSLESRRTPARRFRVALALAGTGRCT